MTGVACYQTVSDILDGVGQPIGALSPVRFMSAVNRAMTRINSRACIYWRELRFPTGRMSSGELVAVSSRYWKPFRIAVSNWPVLGDDLMGILRASCDGTPMRPIGSMQMAGIGNDADDDETPAEPTNIWIARDPALGVRIGLFSKPLLVHWIHFAAWCKVPNYTNAMLALPVVPQAYEAVIEAMLCDLTESESDFHRKTFHQEHLALLEGHIKSLPSLTARFDVQPNTAVAQNVLGAKYPTRSGGNKF